MHVQFRGDTFSFCASNPRRSLSFSAVAMDPSIFYEILEQKYGVTGDPDNDYFGGFGGPIADTIKYVESKWDGKTRNNVDLPPQDWLEEATYPDDESMKN